MRQKSPALKKDDTEANSAPVLEREEQLQVAVWLAVMKRPTQVVKLVKDEFDKDISRQSIWLMANSKRWKPIILWMRNRMLANLLRIPIANKVIRLKNYQKVYDEAMTESLKSTSEWGDVWELKLGAALKANELARVEIEGDKPGVVIDQSLKISIVQQIRQVLEKNAESKLEGRGVTEALPSLPT